LKKEGHEDGRGAEGEKEPGVSGKVELRYLGSTLRFYGSRRNKKSGHLGQQQYFQAFHESVEPYCEAFVVRILRLRPVVEWSNVPSPGWQNDAAWPSVGVGSLRTGSLAFIGPALILSSV
jgi:hypothetical protein